MSPKSQNPLRYSELTSIIDGNDLSEMQKIWKDTALSEERLNLLAKLKEIKLGLNDVQKFSLGLKYSLKSEKLQDKGDQAVH